VPGGGAALDVATGRWTPLPTVAGLAGAGGAARVAGVSGAWTGEALVVVGGLAEGIALAYDPVAGRWTVGPDRPPLVRATATWIGRELLVWGGYGPSGTTSALRRLVPR
jgi:hypothetical protein